MDLKAYFATLASPDHSQKNEDNLVCLPEVGIFGVFDGVGGNAGGQIASALASDVFSGLAPLREFFDLEQAKLWLIETAQSAHSRIQRYVAHQPALSGMATTMCMAAVCGDLLVTANVGDSRARQLEHGLFYRLTEDHGVMDQMAVLAGYSAEDARVIEQLTSKSQAVGAVGMVFKTRNRIARALGSGVFVAPDIRVHSFSQNAINLLYTDGIGDNIVERMPTATDTYTVRFKSLEQLLMLHGCSQVCVDEIVAEAVRIYNDPNCVRRKPDDCTVIVFSR